MGFRFRKTIKLLPGIRLNISKSGISASIGIPGVTANISKHGTRGTIGIPGTGISYSEKLSKLSNTTATPVEAEKVVTKAGAGFGTVLWWGVVGLFGFLLIYGFVTR